MAFEAGMHIGKYELTRKLGEGGFGFVYVAKDTALDRDVALKFLHTEHTANAEILRRFLQEARAAAKIIHPGIVTVFECGQVSGTRSSADGVAYIAMELLQGESLSARISRVGRLPPAQAIEIVWQVASALEAAHTAGIVHRDLKPDNIFVCKDPSMPGGERLKVLDFGIAKLSAQGTGSQTRSMIVMGTPPYMSPEQCKSAANIDHRSDIYALGCILFELVCGKPPFTGEPGELIAKHQMVAPPMASSIAGDISPALDALISAMLAKEVGQRPQTMAAVQRALGDAGGAGTGTAPTLSPDAAASLPRFTPVSGLRAAVTPPRGVRAMSPAEPAGKPPAEGLAWTTLGGAAGEADPAKPRKKRKIMPFVIGGVLVAAGLGGVGYWSTQQEAASHPNAATEAAASPPPSPPPAPVPTPPPATPAKITLSIDSTPKAEIYTPDGRLLGSTPFSEQRDPGEGLVVLTLKADGYADHRVELPADKSATQAFELVALQKPPTAAKPVTKPKLPDTTKPKLPETTTTKPLKPGEIVE